MNYGIMEDNNDTPVQKLLNCIDAGTENCPCYLAVTGDCLICSRLQGKDYCDCNWRGVCIYNEFMQGNGKVNNPRRDFEAEIAPSTTTFLAFRSNIFIFVYTFLKIYMAGNP
jgi:hypothetical protein